MPKNEQEEVRKEVKKFMIMQFGEDAMERLDEAFKEKKYGDPLVKAYNEFCDTLLEEEDGIEKVRGQDIVDKEGKVVHKNNNSYAKKTLFGKTWAVRRDLL